MVMVLMSFLALFLPSLVLILVLSLETHGHGPGTGVGLEPRGLADITSPSRRQRAHLAGL